MPLVFATVRASVHSQHMPHTMIVNRLEANKEFCDPKAPIKIDRSLRFDQKVRPLPFQPEKLNLFTATRGALEEMGAYPTVKNIVI